MKTNLLKITLFACFVTAGITSCTNSPQEKVKQVEEAKENVSPLIVLPSGKITELSA